MNDTLVGAVHVPYQILLKENKSKNQPDLIEDVRKVITNIDDRQLQNESLSGEEGNTMAPSFINLEEAMKNLYSMINEHQNELIKPQLRAGDTVTNTHNDTTESKITKDETNMEYLEAMLPIMEQLSSTIKSVSKTFREMDVIDKAYETSELIIKMMFKNAPKSAEIALSRATDSNIKNITMVNGFSLIEEAFSISCERSNQARKELEYAYQAVNDIAIGIAKRKVQKADSEKNEIKMLRHAAFNISEEFKNLIDETERTIEIIRQQIADLNLEIANVNKLEKENIRKRINDPLKRLRAINFIV